MSVNDYQIICIKITLSAISNCSYLKIRTICTPIFYAYQYHFAILYLILFFGSTYRVVITLLMVNSKAWI